MSLAAVDVFPEELEAAIPSNFNSTMPARDQLAGSVDSLDNILSRLKGGGATPIWSLKKESITLRAVKPIVVRLRFEDNFYFAENSTLVICGTGLTSQEAIADFGLHVVHFHEYYRDLSVDLLTGDAIRLKQLFANLFVEEKK